MVAVVLAGLLAGATAGAAGFMRGGHRWALPDLVVRSVADPPAFIAPSRSFVAGDVTANVGRRKSKATWTLYRLSAGDKHVDVGGRVVPPLRSGERSTGQAVVAVPPGTADGTYRIVACADARGSIRESDESNNCRRAHSVVVIDNRPPPIPVLSETPGNATADTMARFAFSDSEAGTAFACRLDDAPLAPCESPVEYRSLGEGAHRFEVTARDRAGNESAPISYAWTIDTTPPPAPVIDGHPDESTASQIAHFAFSDGEAGAGFTCTLDDEQPSRCQSPKAYDSVGAGKHTFVLTAVDAAGNVSAPARYEWTVVPAEMTLGDGSWSWFADPRAVYDPVRRITYVGWVSRAGDIKVAAYDQSTRVRTTVDLHPHLQVDEHADPAIQLLPDGRIRVFYSPHAGTPLYYRTSLQPGSVSAWGAEQTVPGNTSGPYGYTYPNPVRLAAESRTYLFWRGGNYNPTFATQADGSDTWSVPRNLIYVAGERPYVKYDSDGQDTIYIAFTNAHPREAPDVNIYYVAYRGGELYHADGTRAGSVDAPIAPRDADLVYDGPENAWVHDVAHDADGRPVIVFARFPSLDDHRYMYARWTGTAWSVHEIVAAGGSISTDPGEPQYSAGITLDHEDPSVVYLSRPVNGTYEIEMWKTEDGGAHWTHQPVTTGSTVNNVRPVSPRGLIPFFSDLAVVWVRGTYNTYIDYTTSLTTILKTFGNTPPIADIALTPRSGPAPQQVAFDGRGSSDSDGRVIDWRWDFGDGEQAVGPQVQHTYARPGRYFPTVTVYDDAGGTDVAVEEVDVGASQPPTVVTGPPTRIGDGFVTLSGSIDPRNQPTSYHFDYGPTSAHGATTPEQTIDPGDTADHAVSADVNDLVPGARYHYRLVAHNATGDSAGDDRVMTAAVPAPSAYRAQVLATAGLIAYWRLGELSGSTAADELGSRPGTYAGTVRLGDPGALSDDPDTAAGFDGLSGEMTAPGPELSSGHGSIEGWFDWRSGVAVMRDDTSTGGTGWIVAFDNAGRLFLPRRRRKLQQRTHHSIPARGLASHCRDQRRQHRRLLPRRRTDPHRAGHARQAPNHAMAHHAQRHHDPVHRRPRRRDRHLRQRPARHYRPRALPDGDRAQPLSGSLSIDLVKLRAVPSSTSLSSLLRPAVKGAAARLGRALFTLPGRRDRGGEANLHAQAPRLTCGPRLDHSHRIGRLIGLTARLSRDMATSP